MLSVELPSQVWIHILSFLNDFSTLYNFAQSCKQTYQLIEESSEILHYTISENLHFIELFSFSSASTLYPFESNKKDERFHQGSGLEYLLSKAIFNQMTMMKSSFEHIKTWKDFAKARVCIDRNWRSGNGRWTPIKRPTQRPALGPVWRFKFDPEFNYWVAMGLSGNMEVFSQIAPGHFRRMRIMLEASEDEEFIHLESSGPFIVTNCVDQRLQVWKRIEGAFEGTVPAQGECWPDLEREHNQMRSDGTASLIVEARDSCPTFKLHHLLNMPNPPDCLKARAPYLAAGSSENERVYVWNLETGKIVEEYDVRGREHDDMSYIDFDSNLIFLAGSRHIDIYDRVLKSHRSIPPKPVKELAYYSDKTRDPIWSNENLALPSLTPKKRKAITDHLYDCLSGWVAVHYDHIHGHLVALNREGFLLWTPNYRQTFSKNSAPSRDDFVVLSFAGRGANLCVENGRVAFSSITTGGILLESIYALELTNWTDHASFAASAPRLINVAKIVPSLIPISRLEMDSSAIYATATDARSDRKLYEALQILEYDHNKLRPLIPQPAWLDLDGKTLCSEPQISQTDHFLPYSLEEFKRCWYVMAVAQVAITDREPTSMLAYSFLPTNDLK